jgi:hypothetical protein
MEYSNPSEGLASSAESIREVAAKRRNNRIPVSIFAMGGREYTSGIGKGRMKFRKFDNFNN